MYQHSYITEPEIGTRFIPVQRIMFLFFLSATLYTWFWATKVVGNVQLSITVFSIPQHP